MSATSCTSFILSFYSHIYYFSVFSFFFFNDPAPTDIYTLSLHDALPISPLIEGHPVQPDVAAPWVGPYAGGQDLLMEAGIAEAVRLVRGEAGSTLSGIGRGCVTPWR